MSDTWTNEKSKSTESPKLLQVQTIFQQLSRKSVFIAFIEGPLFNYNYVFIFYKNVGFSS